MNSTPLISDLVFIGGGHAHVHVLKMIGMKKQKRIQEEYGVRITLITRDIHTPYSGMLPGYISGHYHLDEIHIDLQKLCQFANVRLIHASATKIIANSSSSSSFGGMIYCHDDRPPIRYDILSIDVGSAPSGMPPTNSSSCSPYSSHIIPVKPIGQFAIQYHELQKRWKEHCSTPTNNNNKKFHIVIVGGGAGGLELALSVQYNLLQKEEEENCCENKKNDTSSLQMTVVTSSDEILPQHNYFVKRIFKRICNERNIKLYTNTKALDVEEVEDQNDNDEQTTTSSTSITSSMMLICKSFDDIDLKIPFHECLWCTSASAPKWLKENTPFHVDNNGFIQVSDTYQSTSHDGVFAAGDCCSNMIHPRPKAGVFAVRAGPSLTHNLLQYVTTPTFPPKLIKHVPQQDFLGLISTGDQYAIASRGSWFCLEGNWLWIWKDYLDRTWMNKYTSDLIPLMEKMMKSTTTTPKKRVIPAILGKQQTTILEKFQNDPMRCGGCGAKVGSTTVSRVLRYIHERQVERAAARKKNDNKSPPQPIDHDDAAIVPLPPSNSSTQAATIHTIDYFRSFVHDPYLFGKIAAIHALSDVHAMGIHNNTNNTTTTALALAVVPFAAREEMTESTLLHVLSGASDVFQDENVRIVGGHTCEGVEFSCGFAINGYTSNIPRLFRKRGSKVGDVLILTKPLGTGALFAADMRAKSKGQDVMEALQSMCTSNVDSSRIAATFVHDDDDPKIHACTDITGFGFMGHLLEMLMANDDDDNNDLPSVGAILNISKFPFLKGGLDASTRGIYSSLQSSNLSSRRAVSNHKDAFEKYPIQYPLLYDPQTAGGLLFAVDPTFALEFQQALLLQSSTTTTAAIVGEIVAFEGTCENGSCTIASGNKMTGERIHIQL